IHPLSPVDKMLAVLLDANRRNLTRFKFNQIYTPFVKCFFIPKAEFSVSAVTTRKFMNFTKYLGLES
ncbi:MAG: hypothetical protein OXG10_02195, partial [Candidatus Dadabacteria bacterium]|nr:hypothetical protein [Candidatus Dadabacteria bacterium]